MTRATVPGSKDRAPVIETAEDLRETLASIKTGGVAILFFAHRGGKEAWDGSTARVALNFVDPRLTCIPIEVSPANVNSIYDVAMKDPRAVGLNHTTPHKNNGVLRDLLQLESGDARVIDCAVRDEAGGFAPLALNGQGFTDWFVDEFGSRELNKSEFIIRGGGGAGSAIARYIADTSGGKVTIVEHNETTRKLLEATLPSVVVLASLADVQAAEIGRPVVIEATASSDAGSKAELADFLGSFNTPGIFVDLRMANRKPATDIASDAGWIAHDGGGMSAANDYQLVRSCLGTNPRMPFGEFRDLSRQVTMVLAAQATGSLDAANPVIIETGSLRL